jgi:hypothetical protein
MTRLGTKALSDGQYGLQPWADFYGLDGAMGVSRALVRRSSACVSLIMTMTKTF